MSPALAGPAPDISLSVFVMTSNEEINIARCLDSVRWSNDVVVLDSFSSDRTVALAADYPNVRVFQRPFDGFSSQRNFGLHAIAYRNPWLLVLDADEAVEPALAAELLDVARRDPANMDVFLVRRKVFMNGRWLRWNLSFGFWIERLLRPGSVRYEGAVHERVRFTGGYGLLSGWIEHHQFGKGIDDWLARRARYAEIELRSGPVVSTTSRPADLFGGDRLARHAALKSAFHRLPARWLVYFLYSLLFRFPYLDGAAGLQYLFLESLSQYNADRKRKELRHAETRAAHRSLNI